MNGVSIGKAGLHGWRGKAADAAAGPVSRRSPFTDDQVRAAIGALFFALSATYVYGTLRRLLGRS